MYRAKAPGSLMLLGEYSVLQGKIALVATINKFVSITLNPRTDDIIFINSQLGRLTLNRHEITLQAPFEFVLATLAFKNPPSGCNIIINSDFPPSLGLGSSAAVTVALLLALNCWLKKSLTKSKLWQEAIQIVHKVQKVGSGADCAASIFGGTIAFSNPPFWVTSLKYTPPLTVVYSGSKLNTPLAIDIFNQRQQLKSHDLELIYAQMNELSQEGILAINSADWVTLGHLFSSAQGLMKTFGISNRHLDNLVRALQEQPYILGSKISGSGFGDCVIGVGELPPNFFPRNDEERRLGVKQLSLILTSKGASLDET